MFGNGTLNTVVGFTNTEAHYGQVGLGYDTDMANTSYIVLATSQLAQASLAGNDLGIQTKATTGFDLECETAAATHDVDLIIIGQAAS